MMKVFDKDLNEDQCIMRLKQKAKQLRGKGLGGNGFKICPYTRRNGREDNLDRKYRSTVVNLKEKVKYFKANGFDKENNNREDKHQLYDRRSRVLCHNEHIYRQNDDGKAIVSLKEKAKQLKVTGSHTPEVKHQNEREHHKTNNKPDRGDEIIARLKAKAKQLRDGGFGNEINNQLEEGVHCMSQAPVFHENYYVNAAACKPQRSEEVWILFVTNIADEADENEIQDKFCDYGAITNLNMNVDRRTGFCKGYALVQFETYEDAMAAKKALDGAEIMGQTIKVDWCLGLIH